MSHLRLQYQSGPPAAWYSAVRATLSASSITVVAAVAETGFAAAVIVASPSSTARTSPDSLTVATDASLLDQETGNPDSTVPSLSSTSAVSRTVSPTPLSTAIGGVMVMDAGTARGSGGTVASSPHESVKSARDAAATAGKSL